MLRITYASRVRAPLSTEAFDAMVERSRANNWRDGITGLLLFDGLRFMQAIEGRAQPVEDCFARIERDTRHHSVSIVERDERAERQFAEWSLRALDFTTTADHRRQQAMADVASVRNEHLRAAVIGFAALAR